MAYRNQGYQYVTPDQAIKQSEQFLAEQKGRREGDKGESREDPRHHARRRHGREAEEKGQAARRRGNQREEGEEDGQRGQLKYLPRVMGSLNPRARPATSSVTYVKVHTSCILVYLDWHID